MDVLPDWGLSAGPFRIRRWGRFVRFNFRKQGERGAFTFGFHFGPRPPRGE